MRLPITEALQQRLLRENRGQGQGPDYIPWLQVERTGPQTKGRAHLAFNPHTQRQHHLHSDSLLNAFLLIWSTCPQDCREHWPLRTDSVELEYLLLPQPVGTVEAARRLGLRHPIHAKTRTPRILTVDFLVDRVSRQLALDLPANVGGKAQWLIKEAYWASRDVDYAILDPRRTKGYGKNEWVVWALDGMSCALHAERRERVFAQLARTARALPMLQRLATVAQACGIPQEAAVRSLKHAILTRRWRPHPDDHWQDLSLAWAGRLVSKSAASFDLSQVTP